MGRYIDSSSRDDILDALGTACYDGILITPSTIETLSVVGVTKRTPEGLNKTILHPGKQAIPKALYIFDYMEKFNSETNAEKWKILPYTVVYEYENGVLQRELSKQALGRDLLTYAILWNKVIPVLETYKNANISVIFNKKLINSLKRQFEERLSLSKRMLAKEKNLEIKTSSETLMKNLQQWFEKNKLTN